MVITCIIIGIVIWQLVGKTNNKDHNITLMNAQVNPDNLKLVISNSERKALLTGSLWMISSLQDRQSKSCSSTSDSICLEWLDRKLEIKNSKKQDHVECYKIRWTATECVTQIHKDCYELGNAHWYGGYQDLLQHWPLEGTTRNISAFITNDSYVNQIGGVQERYFISTNGIGIYVDPEIPLYISINESNDQNICLISKFEKYPYININNVLPELSYTICKAGNVRKVHNYMTSTFFKKPSDIPDTSMFKYPVWSTWAQYHKDINQSNVMEFAEFILKHNFSHSQLEIDDDWTPRYGDMDFNLTKFPDAKKMITDLNEMDFRVTIWVHPFFNIDSKSFINGSDEGYFIKQYNSDLPALVSWWDGALAAILDPTNPEAERWYLSNLDHLRYNFNISSFKFDAGEVKWLPNIYSSFKYNINPNHYSQAWANLAYKADTNIRHQEVRIGWQTQNLPIFVRMLDKFSLWGYPNGLKTLIPCALTFGILGYPFILPDMIGGNAYEGRHPDKELFIRWLQASTFLPSLQFSIVPWQYDDETIEISRKFVQLHEQYSDKIIALAEDSKLHGSPIVRPLWWIAPDDIHAQIVDSEFLLGDDLLVAPVIQQGARSRDIYLPEGRWRDELRGDTKSGGVWLKNYTAKLHELPYFTKLNA